MRRGQVVFSQLGFSLSLSGIDRHPLLSFHLNTGRTRLMVGLGSNLLSFTLMCLFSWRESKAGLPDRDTPVTSRPTTEALILPPRVTRPFGKHAGRDVGEVIAPFDLLMLNMFEWFFLSCASLPFPEPSVTDEALPETSTVPQTEPKGRTPRPADRPRNWCQQLPVLVRLQVYSACAVGYFKANKAAYTSILTQWDDYQLVILQVSINF